MPANFHSTFSVFKDQSTPAGYSLIRWRDPAVTDMRCRSHRLLEEIIASDPIFKGKWGEDMAHELRLAYQRSYKRGHVSISRSRLDAMYSAHFRKHFRRLLHRICRVATEYRCGVSCTMFAFCFSNDSKAPADNDPVPHHDTSRMVVIPALWLIERQAKWTEYCQSKGLDQNLDLYGETKWGQATFEAMDTVALPTGDNARACASSCKSPKHTMARVAKLTKVGVLRMVFRRRGRLYHALTSLAKPVRRACLMLHEGEFGPTAEVDMHACYWSILAGKIQCRRLISQLQRREFYTQFRACFDMFVSQCRANGDDDPKNIKVEVNRQCLFWRDPRESERPLWRTLQSRHPKLASLITKLRGELGVTGLSDWLTQREGEMFVDDAIPAIKGPALGIHDAVAIPLPAANAARAVVADIASEKLGFVPTLH